MGEAPDRGRSRTSGRARLVASVRGPQALSDAELLSLVTGVPAGAAAALLDRLGGLRRLVGAHGRELEGPGVGRVRALRAIAAVELGLRAATEAGENGSPVRSSADINARLAPRLAPLAREVFLALGLDVRGRVTCEHRVAEGGLDECAVSPRDVFGPLLRTGCAACIVAHNHPSGDPAPSAQDRLLTLRMAEAGRILGLRVVDHVIVAAAGWYSFRDDGAL